MARIKSTSFLYQAFIAFWMLTLVSIGFVTAWIFIYLQGSRDNRRPAFNLKDL
jgi:hypothetical protein